MHVYSLARIKLFCLLELRYVTDTTPAIIAVILIFCCPKKNIFDGHPYQHLIEWKELQNTFPWAILLLLGGLLVKYLIALINMIKFKYFSGGLAMATGFQESGLSMWLGEQLKVLASGSKELTLAILIIISASGIHFHFLRHSFEHYEET